jgi:hypothetical protein
MQIPRNASSIGIIGFFGISECKIRAAYEEVCILNYNFEPTISQKKMEQIQQAKFK